MAEGELTYSCFVIGQMTTDRDRKRLEDLRDLVLEPCLGPLGYDVKLPSESDEKKWFRHVMTMIDTSQILVADLTGDNANAYYELAVRHSLALPYVLVSEDSISSDVSGYNYVPYKPGRPQDARKEIERELVAAHKAVVDGRLVVNPIYDFYDGPLTQISPGAALVHGYLKYLSDVVSAVGKGARVGVKSGVGYELARAKEDWLEVWIPREPVDAEPDTIKKLLQSDPPALVSAEIESESRKFDLFASPEGRLVSVLVDIPRTILSLRDALLRLPRGKSAYADKRLDALVGQEIDRFHAAMKLRVESADTETMLAVRITPWPVHNHEA